LVLDGGNLGAPIDGVGDGEVLINDHFLDVGGLVFLVNGEVGGDELLGGQVHELVGGHGVGFSLSGVVGLDHFVVSVEDGHSVLFVVVGVVELSVLDFPGGEGLEDFFGEGTTGGGGGLKLGGSEELDGPGEESHGREEESDEFLVHFCE